MKRYCPNRLYSASSLMSGGIAAFGGGATTVGILAGVSDLLT
jgi:hypothetical protein